MSETSARLLRLLSLLQAQKVWSGSELADRLGVTTRTVRNDVERLRSMGYPVNAARGNEGGYQLGAGASLPPLLLDDEEAVAVTLGLRNAASGGVQGIEEASVRALAKLEQVLPSHLRRHVSALQNFTVPVAQDNVSTVDATTLTTIAAACRDHEQLCFSYESTRSSKARRCVEPLRLVNWGRRWYLVAFDCERDDWRTFRVDRMQVQTPTGPRFAPRQPPSDDLADYVRVGVNATQWTHQARVTVYMNADELAAVMPPWFGVVEAVSSDECVISLGGENLHGLAARLGLLPAEFRVTEPPELLAALEELSDKFRRAAHQRN